MKILVISRQIPYPLTDGASLCIYNVLKGMAARHEIYLLSFQHNPDEKDNLIYLKDIFTGIYLVELETSKRSIFRYVKNVLSWNSGFLMKEQHPDMYNKFRKKIDEAVIKLQDALNM